jgi:sugar phosphate permease
MALALVCFLAGGMAHGVKNVLFRTLIHTRVPAAARGRAFATYNAARNAAELCALAAGGVVVGLAGPRTALAIAGAVPLAIGVAALLLLPRRPGAASRPAATRPAYASAQG